MEVINMRRKTISILIALLLMAVSLNSNAESIQVDQILSCENATLHISAEVELPLAEKLPVLVAEENRFDIDQILQAFFSETDEAVTVRTDEYDDTDIKCADGSEFGFGSGIFAYRGVHYLHHYREPKFYLKTPEKEIIGFPVEEAQAIAGEWMRALGFQEFELLFTLPMSLESFKKWKIEGQPEPTEQNEGYFFRYGIPYHGTLCMPLQRFSKRYGDSVYGAGLEIFISRSGMQYFSTAAGRKTYRVISEQKRDERIATLDEAIEVMKERYDQLIIPDTVEINRIRFYYTIEPVIGKGVQTYELWPAWVFYSSPYVDPLDPYADEVDPLLIVNAITREIIE